LIQDLLDAATAHDHHNALGEHKWLDLVRAGRRSVLGIVARQPGHEHTVGYAHLSRNDSDWGLEVVVHPEHRSIGIELDLASRALDLIARHGGGHVRLWVFQPSEMHEALAHRLGFTRGRELYQMRRPQDEVPEPRWPEGTHLRTFRPGSDEQTWLDVNNRAFSRHPEQGRWDLETLQRRMQEDWFDPAGFLVADDANGMAGFCWTKVHAATGVGEIYVIGVDPDREGSGLGKALIMAGMRHLASVGAPQVMLYVDADNERAVALYRWLGFEVDHTDRAYLTDVAPVAEAPSGD
jgi:mycothiol synthase